jgi:hypothetical protein
MLNLLSKSAACVVGLAHMLTAAPTGQSKLTVKVHTGRGQVGYDVNSTMIIGERVPTYFPAQPAGK